MKRKLYEDGALPPSSEGSKKVIKKSSATIALAKEDTPAIISVPTPQIVVASGLQGSSSHPSLQKQKTRGSVNISIQSLKTRGVVNIQSLSNLMSKCVCSVVIQAYIENPSIFQTDFHLNINSI